MARFDQIRCCRNLGNLLASTSLFAALLTSASAQSLDWPRTSGSTHHRLTTLPAIDCGDSDNAVCNVARDIARRVTPMCARRGHSLLVASSAVHGIPSADASKRLSARLAASVAGLVHSCNTKATSPVPAPLQPAQVPSRTTDILNLSPSLAAGMLRCESSLSHATMNFWDAARAHATKPKTTWASAQPIDASVTRYLAGISLRGNVTRRIPSGARQVLALQCATQQQTGNLIVTVVSRRDVLQIAISPRHTTTLRHQRWRDLAPISPTPWREPLGTIASPSKDVLDIATTDRTWGVRLDANWNVIAKLTGLPLPSLGTDLCAPPNMHALSGRTLPCVQGSPLPHTIPPIPAQLDAYASTLLRKTAGPARKVTAARNPRDADSLHVTSSSGEHLRIARVGAQVAIADLDMDGTVEIATTAANLTPRRDYLRVLSWSPTDGLTERYRRKVPTGVQALAACPPDRQRARALILATKGQLWIIR